MELFSIYFFLLYLLTLDSRKKAEFFSTSVPYFPYRQYCTEQFTTCENSESCLVWVKWNEIYTTKAEVEFFPWECYSWNKIKFLSLIRKELRNEKFCGEIFMIWVTQSCSLLMHNSILLMINHIYIWYGTTTARHGH